VVEVVEVDVSGAAVEDPAVVLVASGVDVGGACVLVEDGGNCVVVVQPCPKGPVALVRPSEQHPNGE
jgi:hypothetical protein